MKKTLSFLLISVKWLLLIAVAVEVFCFLLITASNYWIYGKLWEGSRMVYDPYALFLDKKGPRPTANNPANPGGPGQWTVWMFGGSTMRSSTETDDTTIPSYVADLLNRPGRPQPCTVMNYGESSFNSLIEAKYLQKLIIESPKPPDLIVFYDGANDCAYFTQYRTAYGHYGYRRLQAAIENYYGSFFGLLKPLKAAVFASFTKEFYDKLMEVAVPLGPGDPELRRMVDLTEKRYEHVRKMAGCYGARFLLIWQPIFYTETGEVAPQIMEKEQNLAIQTERFLAVRHNFAMVYQALLEALKDKPYFFSFQNVLCSRKEPVYEPDGVHLTAPGNEMVARELARVLEERWQQK
jgi:lysophospholipase L1-like esterase